MTWSFVANATSQTVTFAGPVVRDTPALSPFPAGAVTARYVRILPQSYRGLLISLRAEVFGTAVTSEVLSAGPFGWTDYSVSVQAMSWDRGAQGVAVRVQDVYNYYELKVFKGQSSAVHATAGAVLTLSGGSTLASACAGGGLACLLDDNSGTGVTTNADGTPRLTLDLRQYLTVSNVSVAITGAAWTNAQVSQSVQGAAGAGAGQSVGGGAQGLRGDGIGWRVEAGLSRVGLGWEEERWGAAPRPGNASAHYVCCPQIAVSVNNVQYTACGSGTAASVSAGVWLQNCFNQNVRYIQISVGAQQAIALTDIVVSGPAVSSQRALLKRRHGVFSVLHTSAFDVALQTWYPTTLSVWGNTLTFTHGGSTVAVTDASDDPIVSGTVAFTSGQNFASYWDQMSVAVNSTGLTPATPSPAPAVTQPAGTWQYYSLQSPAGAPELLLVTVVRSASTPSAAFALYSKPAAVPTDSDPSIAVDPAAGTTTPQATLLIPNPPASTTYYFGVWSAARSGAALTYTIAGAAPTPVLLSASLTASTAATLSNMLQVDVYKFTPAVRLLCCSLLLAAACCCV